MYLVSIVLESPEKETVDKMYHFFAIFSTLLLLLVLLNHFSAGFQ